MFSRKILELGAEIALLEADIDGNRCRAAAQRFDWADAGCDRVTKSPDTRSKYDARLIIQTAFLARLGPQVAKAELNTLNSFNFQP